MNARSPEHAIELLDEAFNKGNIDTILSYYENFAVVIPQPGIEARSTEEIRNLYDAFMKPGTVAKQIKTHVVEAGGVALFTSRWALTIGEDPPQEFIATTVLRQQPDGGWKVIIDNARGPLVLD